MPRAKTLMTTAVAAAALLLSAGAGAAQTAPGQAAGLRYLSWNGRAAAPTTAALPAAPEAAPARADLRRPNRVIPHGGFARAALPPLHGEGRPAPAGPGGEVSSPAPVSNSLRTAPPGPPRAEPSEAVPPDFAGGRTAYAAPPPPRVEPPRELAPSVLPDYLPSRGGRQPVPADLVMPQPAPAAPVYGDGAPTQPPSEAPADPMAPRRDAPIFRLQRPTAAQPAPPAAPQAEAPAPRAEESAEAAPRRTALVTPNTADRPTRDQGARYYSVHRQNGQTPDALSLPEPTYVDALAVTLAETPASQDLAQPDRGPTLIRDNQGRLRAAPAASDGDHQ